VLINYLRNLKLQKIGPKGYADNNKTGVNRLTKTLKILICPISEGSFIRTPAGTVLYIATYEYILLLVDISLSKDTFHDRLSHCNHRYFHSLQ